MFKHKFLTLFVALIATTALWASNTITYTAIVQLSGYQGSLAVGATTFGPAITSHTFSNGTGTITCSGEITTIGEFAFDDCSSLTSITIPNSVTTIGESAFESCSGLTSVTIPNSVTTIGNGAFFGCTALTSVEIPNSVTAIGTWAFQICRGLTSINVDAANTHYCSIDGVLFNYAKDTLIQYPIGNKRTTYTIPASVTTIGNHAFFGCTALTSVTIPNSVTKIGESAFNFVNNIEYNGTASGSPWDAKCMNGYVDGYLVYSDGFKTTLCGCSSVAAGEIVVPASVTTIKSGTFHSCRGLTSVTIPNSVTTIGNYAFLSCSGLTSVTIPNSVTTIGKEAFDGCSGLTSITIPNSVTTIGSEAFYGCSGLTSVTCYATIPPACGGNCFYNVDKSIPLYVPAESVEAYRDAEGWQDFTNILPITAEEVEVTEPETEPTNNSVVISWPSVADGETYIIEIRKGEELICTLVFNADGQLMSINFAAPARGGEHSSRYATATATGWTYTITGLEVGTEYTYTIVAKDNGGKTLYSETGSFKTTEITTSVENVDSQKSQIESQKFIRNGILYIERNGKTYNVSGQKVK